MLSGTRTLRRKISFLVSLAIIICIPPHCFASRCQKGDHQFYPQLPVLCFLPHEVVIIALQTPVLANLSVD